MIDYYLKDKSLNTIQKINECHDYYAKMDLDYEKIYDEYDKINSEKNLPDKDDKNNFFKRDGSLKEVETEFMKECLLESLKRLVNEKCSIDIDDEESDLNGDIDTYKNGSKYDENHFYNYPDVYENDFADKLYQKEEFNRYIIPKESGNIKDKCDSEYFELAPHQLFLKNLISPNTNYYGLLIFHGVGVGKSCSGISIAENFRDIYGKEENKIIILASQNIRIGWKNTIFNPSRGDNQCTGDSYYYDELDDYDEGVEIDDKFAKKQIKKYYELFGYASFANSVKKMLNKSTKHLTDEKEILKEKINLIKKHYSNRVLIIDEVHNIRSDENAKESRDTIYYIEMVIKYSDKLRLILLTANPMYNINTEIVWLLNMLLMNENKNTLHEKDIFNSSGELINSEILEKMCRGRISYLRGENPVSFPLRLYPTHNKNNIIDSSNSPSLDVFNKKIIDENKLSFLTLYGSTLKKHQKDIYMNEVLKYQGLDNLQIDVENKLLQLSNIVYPGDSENFNDLYGENGLINTMNIVKGIYSYKSETLEEYGEYFHKDIIGDYSSKIRNIIDIISKSDGIVFIYSNWIKSGIIPLVLALEQNGYTKSDGKEVLKGSKRIDKISYEGKYKDEYSDLNDFKPANYLVISGSDLKSNSLEEDLKTVTSLENKNGENIKVVIGSTVASEGLDFKNIRSIHILEPWHNINKLEQVIGRGIRNCSHKALESQDRNVTIYLHTSLIDEKVDVMETIDIYLYRYSEYKAKQIGEIENILKKQSIDKYLFQNGNMFHKNDIDNVIIKPAYRSSRKINYDRSDKAYSRVCSFSKICDYMKDDKPDESYKIPEKNKSDTFQLRYNNSVIEIYKKRIHNLYLNSVCYTLDEIIKIFDEYKDYQSQILYHALREMISDKYLLHNQNGDKGYLIRCDIKYYLFQPYYNNDILLPPYYRINSGKMNHINYEFYERDKLKNMFLMDTHEFSEETILESYKNLVEFKYCEAPDKHKKSVDKYHELTIFKMLNVEDLTTLQYRFDRLNMDDKLVLCYVVLTALIYGDLDENIDSKLIDNLTVVIEKLFIYLDGSKFYYKEKYEDSFKKDLVGFFLFNNDDKKPLFYNYHERKVEPYNKVDEIDIIRMIKKYQKDKILSPKDSWGFTTYYKRIKYSDPVFTHNGIVLKVIKSTDKLKKSYVYPNGPGIVIQDQGASGEWNSNLTLEFIKNEYSEIYDSLKAEDKIFLEKCGEKGRKSEGSKRYLVCMIECILRMTGNLIQNDLIFVKYY